MNKYQKDSLANPLIITLIVLNVIAGLLLLVALSVFFP